MRALVIYESMFGSTRTVAEAVAAGIASNHDVVVVRAADMTSDLLEEAELVVVGAPTHAHGLPRPSTRRGAPGYVAKSHGILSLEPGAESVTGVREWLAGLGSIRLKAAAFDTRANGPAFFTGPAAKPIARALRRHGAEVVAGPVSFIAERNRLRDGERLRAHAWGEELGSTLASLTRS